MRGAIAQYKSGATTPALERHPWNSLDRNGEVVAVYLHNDGQPMCLVSLDGRLVSFFAEQLDLLPGAV